MEYIQQTEVHFVAVVGALLDELFKLGVVNKGVEFSPEIRGANTLAAFALFQECNHICEGCRERLLLFAGVRWLLGEQGVEFAGLKDPRDFLAVSEGLQDGICIAGISHVDETT